MIKTIYTCDHCGKDVPNDYHKNYALMFCNAASGNGDSDYLHGCSREHLGFAVAKAFGIPIDGNWAHTVGALTKKLQEASAHRDNLARDADERLTQLQEARKQIAGLQEQLAHTPPPPNVDGKTPADVAREAFAAAVQNHHESEGVSGWDAAARAVLSAFAPDATQAVREALERVRRDIAQRDVRKEHGQMATDMALAVIDSEFSALPAANLTGPKKPTKPADADGLRAELGLTLPEARCHTCNLLPEKHRLTVAVKWCNFNEIIAEYFPK
jgi:hypothetical protein